MAKGDVSSNLVCTSKGCCLILTCFVYFRCPRFVNLPSYCIYEQDPADACCQKVTCNTGLIPTPQPGTATPPMTQKPDTNAPVTGTNPPITLSPQTNAPVTGTNPPITLSPQTNAPYTGTNPPITLNPNTNAPYTGTNPPVTPSSISGNRGNFFILYGIM